MVGRAWERGADAVILDLEDSVAPEMKDHARSVVRRVLQGDAFTRPTFVRVNSVDRGAVPSLEDLSAAVWPGLAGIVFPKAADAEVLAAVDVHLAELEADRGMDRGSVAVTLLIETAQGLEEVGSLAKGPRVARLQLGERDLVADLGMELGHDEAELLPWRALVVAVSRAHNLQPPLASADPDFRNLSRLEETCRRLRRLGFAGRTAIHPAQIPAIRRGFLPDEDERTWARAVLDSYERALAEGSGVALGPDGLMIDGAIAKSARNLLGE